MPPRPMPPSRSAPPEVVDPRWILKALAAMLVLGLVCAYIAVCFLYARGAWQLVLHPSREVRTTPASVGLQFSEVRFADDNGGQPQLSGWWIPTDLASDPVALVLHSGDGSMADTLPAVSALHDARLNVLVFDYRGFGLSAGLNPGERKMQQDAESALTYLEKVRSVPAASIVVIGQGVGASLATQLCVNHPEIPALILESADGDMLTRVAADPRSRLVPAAWLFHDTFPLADALHTLKTPKLLITFTKQQTPTELALAANPKTTVEIPSNDTTALHDALRRFLDSAFPEPAQTLR